MITREQVYDLGLTPLLNENDASVVGAQYVVKGVPVVSYNLVEVEMIEARHGRDKVETGWLVEKEVESKKYWLCQYLEQLTYSADANDAIRFAREQDAWEMISSLANKGEYKAVKQVFTISKVEETV